MSKKPEKYTTNTEWKTFKEISQIMCDDGESMTITSARNYLYRGLEKMAINILTDFYGFSEEVAKEKAPALAKEESFQEIISDVINGYV